MALGAEREGPNSCLGRALAGKTGKKLYKEVKKTFFLSADEVVGLGNLSINISLEENTRSQILHLLAMH